MIKTNNLSKVYRIYERPSDRLKEALFKSTRRTRYKDFVALKDICFEIEKGETIGIVGKNGSGKSTLLKILTGVLQPTGGDIQVDGKVAAILELGAGFNVEYTGLENIYLNGSIQGKTRSEIDDVLDDILKFADIGDFINQPVKTYSSGMFARLAFAVAINVNPDILIVDEALAVGDMKFQAKCFKKFEQLKEEGVTILFVGHDVSSVRKFCDRTMWLHEGQLILFGDTLSVTAEYMEFMKSNDGATVESKQPLVLTTEQIDQAILNENTKHEFEPINRWGSQRGLIKKVFVLNEKGRLTNTIQYGEVIRVKIEFQFPSEIDRDRFSVAISLKNTMGLDLLVSTTKDDEDVVFKADQKNGELTFEFMNQFTDADLVLVAALEDRSSIHPEYYDYIEGAAYLTSTTKKQLFGIFHTEVRKTMRG